MNAARFPSNAMNISPLSKHWTHCLLAPMLRPMSSTSRENRRSAPGASPRPPFGAIPNVPGAILKVPGAILKVPGAPLGETVDLQLVEPNE